MVFSQLNQNLLPDMKAFTDARVAALKAGLKLTPEQEKTGLPLRLRSAIWPKPGPTAWLRVPMSSHHPIRSSVYTGAPKDLTGWKAGVDGSIVVVTVGAGESIDTNTLTSPIIAFVIDPQGLMYNLSLEG